MKDNLALNRKVTRCEEIISVKRRGRLNVNKVKWREDTCPVGKKKKEEEFCVIQQPPLH